MKTWRPTMQIWWWPPCFKLFCLEQHHCSKSTRPDAFDLLNDILYLIYFFSFDIFLGLRGFVCLHNNIYIYIFILFVSLLFTDLQRVFGDLGNFRWTTVDQRIHLNGPLVGSLPSGISGSSPIAGWFISWKILLKWMRGYPYQIFFRDFHLFQSVEDSFLWTNAGQFHGDLGLASLCSSPWPVPRRTGRDRFLGGTQLPQVFVTLW